MSDTTLDTIGAAFLIGLAVVSIILFTLTLIGIVGLLLEQRHRR